MTPRARTRATTSTTHTRQPPAAQGTPPEKQIRNANWETIKPDYYYRDIPSSAQMKTA